MDPNVRNSAHRHDRLAPNAQNNLEVVGPVGIEPTTSRLWGPFPTVSGSVSPKERWLDGPRDRANHAQGLLDRLVANPAGSKQPDSQEAVVVDEQEPVAALVTIGITENGGGLTCNRTVSDRSCRWQRWREVLMCLSFIRGYGVRRRGRSKIPLHVIRKGKELDTARRISITCRSSQLEKEAFRVGVIASVSPTWRYANCVTANRPRRRAGGGSQAAARGQPGGVRGRQGRYRQAGGVRSRWRPRRPTALARRSGQGDHNGCCYQFRSPLSAAQVFEPPSYQVHGAINLNV